MQCRERPWRLAEEKHPAVKAESINARPGGSSGGVEYFTQGAKGREALRLQDVTLSLRQDLSRKHDCSIPLFSSPSPFSSGKSITGEK